MATVKTMLEEIEASPTLRASKSLASDLAPLLSEAPALATAFDRIQAQNGLLNDKVQPMLNALAQKSQEYRLLEEQTMLDLSPTLIALQKANAGVENIARVIGTFPQPLADLDAKVNLILQGITGFSERWREIANTFASSPLGRAIDALGSQPIYRAAQSRLAKKYAREHGGHLTFEQVEMINWRIAALSRLKTITRRSKASRVLGDALALAFLRSKKLTIAIFRALFEFATGRTPELLRYTLPELVQNLAALANKAIPPPLKPIQAIPQAKPNAPALTA